jgi:hypothetical protein
VEEEFGKLKRKYDQLVQQYDELADLTQKKKLSQAANDGSFGFLKLRVLGDELRDVIQAMDVKVAICSCFIV